MQRTGLGPAADRQDVLWERLSRADLRLADCEALFPWAISPGGLRDEARWCFRVGAAVFLRIVRSRGLPIRLDAASTGSLRPHAAAVAALALSLQPGEFRELDRPG